MEREQEVCARADLSKETALYPLMRVHEALLSAKVSSPLCSHCLRRKDRRSHRIRIRTPGQRAVRVVVRVRAPARARGSAREPLHAQLERSKQTAREIYDEQGQDPAVARRRSMRIPKKRTGSGVPSMMYSDSDSD